MLPMVSIIIPTFNRAYCLPLAISSVIAQSYKSIEILIVDDNSTDNTAQICRKFVAEYGDKVKYIRNEINLGAAESRNIGIQLASGELITFLDSDDLYYLDKIELQVEMFDKNPSAGFCYGHFTCSTDLFNLSNYHYRKWEPPLNIYPAFLLPQNYFIVTPAVMVRKQILEAIGYFNRSMRICEDLELWSRILMHTEAVCITKPIVAIHIRDDECISYFKNIIARHQLYQSVITNDSTLSNKFKVKLYEDLIDIYLTVAKSREGDSSNTVKLLYEMKQTFNKPFVVMQNDIVQLANIGVQNI